MDTIEVVELFTKIDAAIEQDESVRALTLILSNFDKLPDPAPLRERTAEVLLQNGREEQAVEIYERVGLHYVNAGHPARAIAVAKKIADIDHDPAPLVDRFTALYNGRSPFVDREQRHATFDPPSDELVTEPEDDSTPPDGLFDAAVSRALDSGFVATEPSEELPPLPLLSELTSEALARVLDALEYRTFSDLVPVMQPKTTGGELIWTVSSDLTIGEKDPTYRLIPGTLLGMNAHGRSSVPTKESVYARNGSQILSLSSDSLEELREELDSFDEELVNLTRNAFTEALLERHPMFEAVEKDGRENLLGKFQGLRVEEGTRVISQDSVSPGLFLILDGEVDVVREDDDWEITIETLGPGEVFGEMGIVSDKPTQANVVMTKAGHLLWLPGDRFQPVASEHPGLAKYAVSLAQERMDDLETTLSAQDLAEISEE